LCESRLQISTIDAKAHALQEGGVVAAVFDEHRERTVDHREQILRPDTRRRAFPIGGRSAGDDHAIDRQARFQLARPVEHQLGLLALQPGLTIQPPAERRPFTFQRHDVSTLSACVKET
jgi:hypothetical protein